MRIIFLEGTKYDKQAAEQLAEYGIFTQEEADGIINDLFTKKKIHAFTNAKSWLEKHLKGIVRMINEEGGNDKEKALQFIYDDDTLKVFDKYLTYVKDIRGKLDSDKDRLNLDNQFIDKMSFKDVKDFNEKHQAELDKQSKDELSKMKFGSSNYELIPIDSYEEMHKKFGGSLTGDGSSDGYAGDGQGGTAWCHTNSKNTYNSWTSNGEKFFVLARKNFKDIPFNPETNVEMEGKDDYGNSLIAILVNKYGNLKNATLRCNHKGVEYNADNQYKTYAELSKVVGFNVEDEVKKYIKPVTSIDLKDGVYYYSGDNEPDEDIKDEIFKVVINEGVTVIRESAFIFCSNVTSVVMPDSVTRIEESAFSACKSLETIVLSKNLTYIGDDAFNICKSLKSIELPDSITKLSDTIFSYCENLESVKLPANIETIPINLFEGCSSLKSITIPSNVEYINSSSFYECKALKEIVLPEEVKTIGDFAFFGCRSLKSVTIPKSVSQIGDYAFIDCKSLDSVIIPNPLCRVSDDVFGDNTTVTCGISSYAYKRLKGTVPVNIDTSLDGEELYDFLDENIREYCSKDNPDELVQSTLNKPDDYYEVIGYLEGYLSNIYGTIVNKVKEGTFDFSRKASDMNADVEDFLRNDFADEDFEIYLTRLASELEDKVYSIKDDMDKRNRLLQAIRNLRYKTNLWNYLVEAGLVRSTVDVDVEDYYNVIQKKLKKDGVI